MSVSTIGNIDVKVNVAEIKTAVTELNNLAKVAGATQSALDKLSGIKLDNIRVSVSGVRGDIAGLSGAVQLATNRLQQMAATNLGALSSQAQSLTNAFNQTTAAGNAAAAAAGKVGSALRAMTQVDKLNAARDILDIRSFHAIGREIAQVEAAYKRLAASGKLSASELEVANQAKIASINKLRAEMGETTSTFGKLQSLLSTGLVIGGVSIAAKQLIDVGVAAYNAYQPIQSLTMAIRGLGGSGAIELSRMRDTANKLGVEFTSITKPMLQWTASLEGTKLEGEKGAEAFEKIVGAMKVMGASTDDIQGALRALTQMLSKGTVQAEELRGQLGERFPGAMKYAAEAMGLSMVDFAAAMKKGLIDSETFVAQFADVVHNKLGGSVVEAANTTQSELNRVKNSWTELTAHIGKKIDTIIGKIFEFTRAQSLLDGFNVEARANDNILDDKRSADKNKVSPETLAQIRLNQFKKSGGVIPQEVIDDARKRSFRGANGTTNATQAEIAAEVSAQVDKLSANNKKLWTAIVSATADSAKYVAEQREALKARQEQAAGAADKGARARGKADAMASGDARKIAEATLEGAQSNYDLYMRSKGSDANSAQGLKLYEELAKAKGTLAKLDKKDAKAGAANDKKEQNAADRALNERDTLVNRSTTYSAQLNEQRLRLSDGEGMAGEIARTNRQYDDLISRLEKVKNLSDDKLRSGKEEIEAQRKAALEQIDSIKKIKDEQENAREVEQQRLQIQRELNSETKSGNTFFRHFDATLALAGNGVSKYISDFQDGYSIKSKYSKEKDAFVNSGLAKNDEAKLSINQKIEEQKYKILDAEEALSKTEDKTNEAYKEREKLVERMRENLNGLNDRRKLLETSRDNQKNQLGDAFNQGYDTKRMVSYGVVSGAQDYMDGIKGKAERASEQVNKFGSALTSVFMAKSWGDAKNSMKGFFAGLLTSIQEAIIQLLIVKPIIDSIQTAFKGASGGEKSGGLMGLFSSLITNAITGGVGSMGNAGMGDYSAAGMSKAFTPQANGGGWNGGVQYFANGGVFDRPTGFTRADGGLGVLGEKTPESIMPLKRNSRGQLGVIAEGGGSNQILNNLSINIAGNASTDTVEQIKSELLPLMNELARNQANNAVAKSNRPGGMNYGR